MIHATQTGYEKRNLIGTAKSSEWCFQKLSQPSRIENIDPQEMQ